MDYSIDLLPNSSNKLIDCNLSESWLIRRVDLVGDKSIHDPVTKKVAITNICSPEERVDDLSSSLLGVFTQTHLKIKLTESGIRDFAVYCNPDDTINPMPIYQQDFTTNGSTDFWCAKIGRLHNIDFNYTRENKPFLATCLVVHTPMRWNYWHFSLRWKINTGPLVDLDEKEKKKIAKRIGASVRVLIAQFAVTNLPEYEIISEDC